LDDDDSSGYSSDDRDDNKTDGVVSWRSCFHERFLEETLIPRQARLTDESRDQTVTLIAALNQRVKDRLRSGDGSNDRAWIKEAVEDAVAGRLTPEPSQ
jgi:hypothetical protein